MSRRSEPGTAFRPDRPLDGLGERVPDATGIRLGIVAARWHHDLVDRMVDRIAAAASAAGAEVAEPVRVPGAGELPLAAQLLARTGTVDALVAAAVVIRGGTPHFETVLRRANTGLLQVSLAESIPIADAVLGVLDADQATARIGGPGATEDKGAAAAVAALELALLHRALPGGGAATGAIGTAGAGR